MNDPNEKDKNRQGSSGRPGTKFLERPRSDSDAGTHQLQGGGEDLSHDSAVEGAPMNDHWKVAKPNPRLPKEKDQDQAPKKQSGQGGDEETMGQEV